MRAFGLNRCQKGGLKKDTKKRKRVTRATQGKQSVGLWAPLRLRKQDIRTSTGGSNTPDEPKGTVADSKLVNLFLDRIIKLMIKNAIRITIFSYDFRMIFFGWLRGHSLGIGLLIGDRYYLA